MSKRGTCLDGASYHAPIIRRNSIQQHITLALLTLILALTPSVWGNQESTKPAKDVTLCVGGVERQVKTHKETVQTLLHQEHIVLNKHDRCEPPITAPIEDGMTVVITRITCEHIVETVSVPAPVVVRWNRHMSTKPLVVRKGKPGVAKQTRVVWKKDGVVSEEWTNAPVVVVKPAPEIVVRGSLSSRGLDVRRVLTMRSTAYTPYDAGCNGRTAMGTRAGRGVVAVDPRVIPLGTRLYVEGYGPAIASDTGGAIKGNIIDVCFPSRKEAFKWGRRTVTVMILE